MFWGSLQRMILVELLKTFSVALVALTGLILMAGVISEAMKNGLGPMQILTAIPLLLPVLLPYTVPTTTLFASCIVYGRLSADNEIIALKAAGIHIIYVIWPALFLGLAASAVTMFLYVDLIPCASFLLKTQLGGDVEDLLYATLRKDGCIKHAKVNYEIHAKDVQGRILHDAIYKRRAAGGAGFDFIACAKESELHVDVATKQIIVTMRQCDIIQGNTVGFLDDTVWAVEMPTELGGSVTKLRAMDMTWDEMFEYEEKTREEKEQLGQAIDTHRLQIMRGRAEAHFTKHVKDLANEWRVCDNHIFSIESEMHMRPALALGCFCFALVGCPIGIWFSKSDYLSAFITCFLPIVTLYYPLLFCMFNMARAGKVPPWLAIYNADLLLLSAGLILFRRLARG